MGLEVGFVFVLLIGNYFLTIFFIAYSNSMLSFFFIIIPRAATVQIHCETVRKVRRNCRVIFLII